MQARGWAPATSTRLRQTAKPAGLGTPRRRASAARGLPNNAQMDLPGSPVATAVAWAGPSSALVATTPPAKALTATRTATSVGRRLDVSLRSQPRQDEADP